MLVEQRPRHRAADNANRCTADEGHAAGENAGGRAQDQAPLRTRAAGAIADLARLDLAIFPGENPHAAQLDVVIGLVPGLELAGRLGGCFFAGEVADDDVLVLVRHD